MPTFLTCAQAAQQFPAKRTRESIWRYARKGVKCRDGSTICLGHIVVGREIFIPEDAIEPFIKALTDANALKKPVPAPSPAPTRRRDFDIQAILKRGRLR